MLYYAAMFVKEKQTPKSEKENDDAMDALVGNGRTA